MENLPGIDEVCLNCGSRVARDFDYCPNCGQKNREPRLPLRRFIADFFQDYLALDSRIIKSIGGLILKPGMMTREFNSGKRLTYIPPFRIYIFTSFTYFFLLALIAPDDKFKFDIDPEVLELGYLDDQNENDSLNEKFYSDSTAIKYQNDSLLLDSGKFNDSYPITDSLITNNVGKPSEGKYRAAIQDKLKRITANPELFKQALFRALSITVFFLLPVFAFLLYITHFRKHPFYVEHLVYSVHFHTFIFILFLFFLIGSRFNFSAFWLGIPVSFVYFILSLRNAYAQSLGKALIKSILIIPVYTVLLCIALLMAVLVGAYMA
jgi:hypothetical protein